MRFTVPTHYQAEYLLPRKRNTDNVVLNTDVIVEIREVSSSDAPIVHIIGDFKSDVVPSDDHYSAYKRIGRYEMVEGQAIEIRMVDGEMYKQIATVSTLQKQLNDRDKSRESVFSSGYYGDIHAGLYGDDSYNKTVGKYSTFSEFEVDQKITGVRSVTENSSEVGLALQKYADDLLIIDGFVYERTVEPALSLHFEQGHVRLRLCETEDPELSKHRYYLAPNSDPSGSRFGLDEFERAVSEGRALAKRYNLNFVCGVEVRKTSDWAIEFRADLENLYNSAKNFVHQGTKVVGALDEHLAMAWYDLSIAVSNHHQPTKQMLDALRAIEVGDINNLIHVGSSGKSIFVDSRVYVGADDFVAAMTDVKEALRMWDARSENVVEWFDTSLQQMPTYSTSERAWEIVDCRTLRQISDEYDTDLTQFMTAALEGSGNIIVVSPIGEDSKNSKAVALVEVHDGEPRIKSAVTKRGVPMTAEHAELALNHVRSALSLTQEKDQEFELTLGM